MLGWRESYYVWNRLGEQLQYPPTSYSQLLALKGVKRNEQKPTWNEFSNRLKRAPTAEEIRMLADGHDAWIGPIPRARKAPGSAPNPEAAEALSKRLKVIADEISSIAITKGPDDMDWVGVAQLAQEIREELIPVVDKMYGGKMDVQASTIDSTKRLEKTK